MMNWRLSLAPKRVPSTFTAMVGLGLLTVLAFSLNALFTSRSQQPPQTAGQPQAPVSQPPPPAPTSDRSQSEPTAAWKVYTNADFSFSINYPPTWSFSEDKSDPTHRLPIVYFFDATREKGSLPFLPYEGISVSSYPNPTDLNSKEWLRRSLSQYPVDLDKDFGYEPLSVAGTQGLKVTGLPSRFETLAVYISHNSKMYVLVLEPFSKTKSELHKNLRIFDVMMGTLKFSD